MPENVSGQPDPDRSGKRWVARSPRALVRTPACCGWGGSPDIRDGHQPWPPDARRGCCRPIASATSSDRLSYGRPAWRYLPHDFPPWATVYGSFTQAGAPRGARA
ncbi:hypothetical protein GCM10027074_70560 [Streptomyces deserti]